MDSFSVLTLDKSRRNLQSNQNVYRLNMFRAVHADSSLTMQFTKELEVQLLMWICDV